MYHIEQCDTNLDDLSKRGALTSQSVYECLRMVANVVYPQLFVQLHTI